MNPPTFFTNPFNSLLRDHAKQFKITTEEITEHFKSNTNAFLPFFNVCPNCKSIDTGNVGTCENLGCYQDSTCLDCDTRFGGIGINYLQMKYRDWLVKMIKDSYRCHCDCECTKETNEEIVDQCDDCDNGIHWDNIRKIYVNYEEPPT